VWIYAGNILPAYSHTAKFHGNILSLNENIAKVLGATFLTHTVNLVVTATPLAPLII